MHVGFASTLQDIISSATGTPSTCEFALDHEDFGMPTPMYTALVYVHVHKYVDIALISDFPPTNPL